MEFATIEASDKRVTTWILGIGEVLGVRHYMSLERLYRAAYDQNMRCGGTSVALVPDFFDPFMHGEWQLMTEAEYEQLINFTPEQLMLHRTAESNLREIDTAPLTYCMNGCLHDCTQLVGERGQLLPPALFRVYYLRAGGDLVKIVVSCKPSMPAGDGYCDHGGRFVITEAAFAARKASLVAKRRWELKLDLLQHADLPHIVAGRMPELREEQEYFDDDAFPDQQCGAVRVGIGSPMLADFMMIQPAPAMPSEGFNVLTPVSTDDETDDADLDVMIARQLRLFDAQQPRRRVEHRRLSDECGLLPQHGCCGQRATEFNQLPAECQQVVRGGGYCSLAGLPANWDAQSSCSSSFVSRCIAPSLKCLQLKT